MMMKIMIKILMQNSEIVKNKILYFQANLHVRNQSKNKSNQVVLESQGETYPQTQKSKVHTEMTMDKHQLLYWFQSVYKV